MVGKNFTKNCGEPAENFPFERSLSCNRAHPLKNIHTTIPHLLGLDDNKLTYFHAGRFAAPLCRRTPGRSNNPNAPFPRSRGWRISRFEFHREPREMREPKIIENNLFPFRVGVHV